MQDNGVSIIGTVGIPARYGGFETLVEHLVKANNRDKQFRISVYCSSIFYKGYRRPKSIDGAELIYLPLHANGITSVLYDFISILHTILFTKNRNILILGVGGSPAIPLLRILTKRKIITNIDGLEWKRQKWGKLVKAYLYVCELLAVKFSHHVIADNEEIVKYVDLKYQRISHLIPYGGDHTIRVSNKLKTYTFENVLPNANFALSVARIEPENNPEMILHAFSMSDARLVFIGNWKNSSYSRNLYDKFCAVENITLLEPIYDLDILFRIRSQASIYIHGHSAGGSNPSLIEAMFLQAPILAFDCQFNRKTTGEYALFFADSTALAKLLNENMEFSSDSISLNAYNHALKNYTWEKVAKQYFKLFAANKKLI